ncbi:unnamed protein product [Pylaiella littoralis]
MDIRVLAHRKLILKGIEDLRRGGRLPNDNMPPPPVPTPTLLPKQYSGSDGCNNSLDLVRDEEREIEVRAPATSEQQRGCHREEGGNHRLSPGRRKKLHWSAIKPLSENQMEGGINGGSSPAVNLADGQYDEAAAHSSFADAVAEWRGEGRHATTTAETPAPPPSLHRPSLVGRAPLAEMTDGLAGGENIQLLGGAKPRKIIRQGLLGGEREGSGGTTECWTNPFSSPRESAEPQTVDLEPKPNSPPRRTKTVILRDAEQQKEARGVGQNVDPPALDENIQHEAFRRAVAEWRDGGGDDGSAANRVNRAGGVIATTTEALPSRRAAEVMAEELREQMDAEHRRQAKGLEEKKRALLDGLNTTEAERCSMKLKQQQQLAGDPADHATGGSYPHEFDEERPEDEAAGDDAHLHEAGDNDRSTTAIDDSERVEGPGSGGVEIEIMESVLGSDLSMEGGPVSYVVDEGDSDDEF